MSGSAGRQGQSSQGMGGQGTRRAPLLDRLLDAQPELAQDPPQAAAEQLEVLRHSIRRDLEALLNTRRRRWLLPPGLPALAVSPLGYGIPDATAGSYAAEEPRAALAHEVEEIIRRFEPRLRQVSVRLHPGDDLDRTLRLTVTALLQMGVMPEPVAFETTMEAVTRNLQVTEG